MDDGRGTVPLPSVSGTVQERDRPSVTYGPSGRIAANDCTTDTVDAGDTILARIHCTKGSGSTTLQVTGCLPDQEASAWLTLDTPYGLYGQGNATASVEGMSLRIQASADEGKQATLPQKSEYALALELEDWRGEAVTATVTCNAA